jgi:hypothetical protein
MSGTLPSGTWRVDPERVGDLAVRLRATVAELESISASDPAARAAITALRTAAEALRATVVPAVDALTTSTALTRAPECSVGDPIRGRPATRRPAPVTPAGRASRLVADVRDGDDAAVATALGRLARLLERRPALADLDVIGGADLWNRLLDRSVTGGVSAGAAAAVIARLTASGAERSDRIDAVAAAGAHSGDGVRLVSALAAHLDDDGLVELIGRLLERRPLAPHGAIHPPSLIASIHRLLDAVIDRPGALARLGAEGGMLGSLIADEGLDTDTVAAALGAVLGAIGPTTMLGHLMHAEGRSTAAARVAAVTMAAILDDLTPSLSSSMVAVAGSAGTTVIGDRRHLDGVFRDIAADREATAILGVAIGALRTERIERGLDAVAGGGVGGEQTIAATLAGQLAGVDRLVDLLAAAADDADAAAAAERATLLAHSSDALVLLGVVSSVVVPQVRPVLSLIGVVGGRLAEAAERPAIGGGDADRLRMATEVEVIGAVAGSPELRSPLGLDEVPDHVWDEVGDLVDRHRHAPDDASRAEAHARLMVVVAESVPLTTILNTVGALSDR